MNDKLTLLTEKEKKEVYKILNQLSVDGVSDTYNKLLSVDYDEIPVDIETFLKTPKYLGNGLINEEGVFTVYPYWVETLKKIFPDPLKPAKYNTLALTGAIGLGKSFMAVLVMLYELYRMLCLKDPYVYYGLQPIDKITFATMNITLDASKGVAWDKMQQLLQTSEWFMEKGSVSGSVNVEWMPPKGIELIAGSLPRHILGRAVFSAFLDEISFQPNQDVEKQKEKARELVSAASTRMQSRFMKGDKNPTILIIASSKRTEQSFMETFIQKRKELESSTTLIIDEPQWVIRNDKNSNSYFKVAIGNKFLASEIIPLNASEKDLQLYRDRGFNLLDVPIGYYEQFREDIDKSLQDIAGISTTSSSRYISGPRLAEVKNDLIKNPFQKDIIEVGNSADDTTQYSDFFNLDLIDKSMMEKPLYVHLDMSISGDKTGIAGVWIKGIKAPEEGQPDNRELVYKLAFSVAIKAPKGYQVSFEKNRQFIYWLRETGFNVKGVSCDTFQSYDLLQQLSAKNFNTEIISVDRVTDKICQPYQYFKSTIYEKRIEMYNSSLLTEELIGLERNNNNGKIDHSPSGVNCFTGDTKIQLVDGRTISILELLSEYQAGKTNYVYSFNHKTSTIEPKPINKVWCSGKNAKILEITLDTGETITCTPEHKFMLRDGSYCQAKDLQENTSLMPLYTKLSSKGLLGYRLYYEPMEEEWHYEHRRFCVDVDDEKYLVHHKDCNKLNNSPNNLVWCSKGKHQQLHAELQTGAQSPSANKKRSNSVKKYHQQNNKNPEYWTRYAPYKELTPEKAYEKHKERVAAKEEKKKIHELKHKNNQDRKLKQFAKQQEMAEVYGVDLEKLEGTQLQSYMIKYAHDIDPTYQQKVSAAVSENHRKGKYKKAHEALQKYNQEQKGKKRPKEVIDKMKATKAAHGPYEVSEDTRKKLSEITSKRRWYNNGEVNIYINPDEQTIPDGFVRGRIKTWKNHKIKLIKYLDYTADVYDLEIKDNHNFALGAGVFVHNSKDTADAVCGALWNASNHAEEFDFEYGDRIDLMIDASSDTLFDNRAQLTVDFEEELKKVANDFHESLTQPQTFGDDYYLANDIIIL